VAGSCEHGNKPSCSLKDGNVPSYISFEVLTAVKMSMLVFWVVTQCRRYQHFGGTFSSEDRVCSVCDFGFRVRAASNVWC
jgi:hypothetical protein